MPIIHRSAAGTMPSGLILAMLFFNVALRHAKSLKDAFVVARTLVQKRELRDHFEPSNPLMAGGANVQPLLIPHP
jgi:hypothetical protein